VTRICSYCGSTNPLGKVLCAGCGKLLNAPAMPPQAIPRNAPLKAAIPAAQTAARDAPAAAPLVSCPHCGTLNLPGKVWCKQCNKGMLAPPPTAAQQQAQMSAEFRERLDREGAKSGDVQVSLMWNNYNDLDLHVVCPCGQLIYFGDRQCPCGGELDVDMNVSPDSTEPVENIYWSAGGSPAGSYQVYVNHFNNHNLPGCDDPTAFRVAVVVGGQVQEFEGEIEEDETLLIHEFTVPS